MKAEIIYSFILMLAFPLGLERVVGVAAQGQLKISDRSVGSP